MKQKQIQINDSRSVREIKNQWSYKVGDNYAQYTKALKELKKKHHTIYQKIQADFEAKLGYRVGRDVEWKWF